MDEKIKQLFSENLRRQLILHDKKQADLSDYMKVSTATASDWCNGKKLPRADKIQSICNWLMIDIGDLLGVPPQNGTQNLNDSPINNLTADKIKLCESLTDSEVELFLRLNERTGKSREVMYHLLNYIAKTKSDADLAIVGTLLERIYTLETSLDNCLARNKEYKEQIKLLSND